MGYRKTRETAVKKTILLLFVSELFLGIALAGAVDLDPSPFAELDRLIQESMINETIAALEHGERPLSGVELLFGKNAEEARKPWCIDPFTIMIPSWVALTDHIDRLIHEVASGKKSVASIDRRPRINMNRVGWYRGACESSEDQWSTLEKRFEAEFNITEEERAEAYDIIMSADIISERKKLEEKVIENPETILTFEFAKKDYMKLKIDWKKKIDDLQKMRGRE